MLIQEAIDIDENVDQIQGISVEQAMLIRGMSKQERSKKSLELLSQLRLEGFADSYPSMLSQGMQQRVAIARTLAIDRLLVSLLVKPLL